MKSKAITIAIKIMIIVIMTALTVFYTARKKKSGNAVVNIKTLH